MKKVFLFLVLSLFVSCRINKRVNGNLHGVWITKYYLDEKNKKFLHKSREVYRAGIPIRTWKTYLDGKLVKKEKYFKDTTATVTHFYLNGKIEKKGRTKTTLNKKETHWFYEGSWEFFKDDGSKTHTTLYVNGVGVKTDSIK